MPSPDPARGTLGEQLTHIDPKEAKGRLSRLSHLKVFFGAFTIGAAFDLEWCIDLKRRLGPFKEECSVGRMRIDVEQSAP
ncbi:hypothetical protein [Bradyrhizobium sp. USDA 4506]